MSETIEVCIREKAVEGNRFYYDSPTVPRVGEVVVVQEPATREVVFDGTVTQVGWVLTRGARRAQVEVLLTPGSASS